MKIEIRDANIDDAENWAFLLKEMDSESPFTTCNPTRLWPSSSHRELIN
ncbi:hypothetical protein [Zooshikella ganghwensis]|nr:hypothetical protein [Zooshikella ganghwensis]